VTPRDAAELRVRDGPVGSAIRPSEAAAAMMVRTRPDPGGTMPVANENRDAGEPPHVHVRSNGDSAVFWLTPVSLRESSGYTPREIERIRRIVVASRSQILRQWDEFFDHRSSD
jgi:hypothetical protein